MTLVNIRKLKYNPSEVIRCADEKGFVVVSRGKKPVAIILSLSSTPLKEGDVAVIGKRLQETAEALTNKGECRKFDRTGFGIWKDRAEMCDTGDWLRRFREAEWKSRR